jgi:hypothetical protein
MGHSPATQSYLLQFLATVAGVAAVGCWLFLSWFMWVIRCDDVCGGDDADKWQWTGQAFLAVPGSALLLGAVVLGTWGRRSASRAALGAAAACAVGWLFVLTTM